MKTILLAALAVVAMLSGTADAVTLEATSGTVLAFAQDSVINIGGDNWSLASTAPFGDVTLTSAFVFNPTFIVDGVNLSPPLSFDIVGVLSMTLAEQPPLLFVDPFVTTFTMTGFVNLGGGFDLIGQGTVVVDPPPGGGSRHATYTFVAAEPSTLLLFGVGVGVLLTRHRRGRFVQAAEQD